MPKKGQERIRESNTILKREGINPGKSYKEYLEEAGIKVTNAEKMFLRSKMREHNKKMKEEENV